MMENKHLELYMAEDACGLKPLSGYEAREPEFLWRPYLRLANLNLLRGNGGSGKTSLAFALAAAISRGEQPGKMPGKLKTDGPQNTIYLGAEDEPETYRAMWDRQGGDPERMLIPSGRTPTLGEIVTIEKMIQRYNAALLIIDPIQALLPEGVDMNRSNEVRPILDGLRRVCRQTCCTALILEHLNKATKAANLYRGNGTMDFLNGARSVLITGRTEDGRRACGHLKANATASGSAILFDIEPGGRFVWQGSDAEIDGEDILTARNQMGNKKKNPYERLIMALISEKDVWEGTATEAIKLAPGFGINDALSPEGFGNVAKGVFLPGVMHSERRTGRERIHRFEKGAGHA